MKRKLLAIILLVCVAGVTRVNAMLPEVVLQDTDGEWVDVAGISLQGKPVIVSFFATWCKPCVRELKAIDEVFDEWSEETGVEMVLVSTDQGQDVQKVKPFVDGNGWDFHVLLDPDGELKRAMNVQNIPHVFVLDKEGKIVYNHVGYTDGDELEIEKYLK